MTIKQFWINLIRDIKENFFSILLSTIGILIFSYASSILYKYYTSVDCILDYKNYNISNTKLLEPNEYGDYFGGVMNPLIGITAAFITFLAFYIQFVANRKITGQFKTQQFESHFYEMLRLHKENVDELEVEIISLTSIKSTSGHHVRWEQQFKTVKGRNVFIPLSNEIEIAFNSLKTTGESDLMKVFKESYKVFFNGLNKDSLFYTTLESVKVNHEEEYWNRKKHGLPNEFFYGAKMKAFYEIFLGHENMLGHYYRHLYHMVKFVVIENDTILNYKDKRKYLKLLRAQLSNYEQAMLFYNWLAGNGENWEKNKFFTDYRMIHNLHDNILIDQGYFVKIKKSLRESNPNYKMLDDDDFLFESDTEK